MANCTVDAAPGAETLTAPQTWAPASFAQRLMAWQRSAGRHGLPWQATRDPYRVWLSEIMLQQTQVRTVLGYYGRFLQAFPDVHALAAADTDAVMQLWSGLGYYSRARNLHRAAQTVVAQWGGQFPRAAQDLATLPGIGRSTAHAIAAFCFGARETILDANVQRVMARHWAFDGDLAQARAVRELWALAEQLLPVQDLPQAMPAYTQGLMDLGATVCTPRRPRCTECPVARDCRAYAQELQERYPVRTRKLKRSAETWYWLVAVDAAQRVLLYKRPDKGIWSQLYCFPTFDAEAPLQQAVGAAALQWSPGFRHALTHKELTLVPVVWQPAPGAASAVDYGAAMGMTDAAPRWWPIQAVCAGEVAVPAPLLSWLQGWGRF